LPGEECQDSDGPLFFARMNNREKNPREELWEPNF
jgi:hypothetical protein